MTAKRFISLLLCLLLLSSPVLCLAQSYTVTEPQLTRLEQIFQQLSSLNSQLTIELELSKQDLEKTQQLLLKYQQDLDKLQTQLLQSKNELTLARTDLKNSQDLLVKANQSLQTYEKQVKAEMLNLKIQRNGFIVGMVYFAVQYYKKH